MIVTGKIVSGAKQAAFFTQLDWVQKQCDQKIGFKPFPGTLNIEISDETVKLLRSLRQEEIPELRAPDADSCSAKIIPVTIENIQAAIVIPDEKVRVHGINIIEIVSAVRLKDDLSLKDGDTVSFSITYKD